MGITQGAVRARRGRAFTDDRGKIWTATGVAGTVSSPSRFGGGALDLSATAVDSLETSSGVADFGFSGLFTIDFWLYWTGVNAGIIFAAAAAGPPGGLAMKVNANGSLTASEFAVADFLTTAPGGVLPNTWQHVALSRDASGFVRIHIGGINSGGTTRSTSFAVPGAFSLGSYFSGAAENSSIHLDDFRVANGATRHTNANFAPPSAEAPAGPADPLWANVVSLLRFN